MRKNVWYVCFAITFVILLVALVKMTLIYREEKAVNERLISETKLLCSEFDNNTIMSNYFYHPKSIREFNDRKSFIVEVTEIPVSGGAYKGYAVKNITYFINLEKNTASIIEFSIRRMHEICFLKKFPVDEKKISHNFSVSFLPRKINGSNDNVLYALASVLEQY